MQYQAVTVEAPPQRGQPVITKEHLEAGLAAVFSITEKWGLSNDETQALLGSPSRATYFNWKKNQVKAVPHDTITRISYILGIYKALHILYTDPSIADDWVNRANLGFGGQSARERMLAGEITDLAFVRDYLDGVRGAWA